MLRTRIIGLAALILCLPSALRAETIGYSISDTTRNLYRINLEIGAATSLGVIPFDADQHVGP